MNINWSLVIVTSFFFVYQLLSFPIPNCPRYQVLMNETERTDIFLNMTKTYKVSLNLSPDYLF